MEVTVTRLAWISPSGSFKRMDRMPQDASVNLTDRRTFFANFRAPGRPRVTLEFQRWPQTARNIARPPPRHLKEGNAISRPAGC
jgi:hypothetical protein